MFSERESLTPMRRWQHIKLNLVDTLLKNNLNQSELVCGLARLVRLVCFVVF